MHQTLCKHVNKHRFNRQLIIYYNYIHFILLYFSDCNVYVINYKSVVFFIWLIHLSFLDFIIVSSYCCMSIIYSIWFSRDTVIGFALSTPISGTFKVWFIYFINKLWQFLNLPCCWRRNGVIILKRIEIKTDEFLNFRIAIVLNVNESEITEK